MSILREGRSPGLGSCCQDGLCCAHVSQARRERNFCPIVYSPGNRKYLEASSLSHSFAPHAWISSGPSVLPSNPTFISSVYSSTVQDNHRRKTMGSRAKQRVLRLDTKKHNPWKEKLINWASSKLKEFALWKTLLEWKDNLYPGRKYLQVTYLTKDLYLEYIKNFKRWTIGLPWWCSG